MTDLVSRSKKLAAKHPLVAAMIALTGGVLLVIWSAHWASSRSPLQELMTLPVKGGATAVAWSPDGTRLAAIHDFGRQISVWKSSGELIRVIPHPMGLGPYLGRSLVFMPDNRTLLGPAPNDTPEHQQMSLGLWNTDTGELERLIAGPAPGKQGQKNSAKIFALSPDASLVAMSPIFVNEPVTVYSTDDWSILARRQVEYRDLPCPPIGSKAKADFQEPISSLTFSKSDNSLFIGLFIGIALSKSLKDSFDLSFIECTQDSDSRSISKLAISPVGDLLAVGTHLTSDETRNNLRRSGAGSDEINRLANFKIWNAQEKRFTIFDIESANVRDLSWSGDGRYVASLTYDQMLKVYEPAAHGAKPVAELKVDGGGYSLSFSPNSNTIAVALNKSTMSVFSLIPRQ
ncbi:MAG: WD40 repeat domain-containing protein [Beijerinckiaceae bacterium]|nr:WD40 repeat domain-containing protein [Beijerinckiaceae bacterium]